ncbi:hypothetical protein LXL04_004799 [Taraxacum kok-saghyz]
MPLTQTASIPDNLSYDYEAFETSFRIPIAARLFSARPRRQKRDAITHLLLPLLLAINAHRHCCSPLTARHYPLMKSIALLVITILALDAITARHLPAYLLPVQASEIDAFCLPDVCSSSMYSIDFLLHLHKEASTQWIEFKGDFGDSDLKLIPTHLKSKPPTTGVYLAGATQHQPFNESSRRLLFSGTRGCRRWGLGFKYIAASQVHGGQYAAGFVDGSVKLFVIRTPRVRVSPTQLSHLSSARLRDEGGECGEAYYRCDALLQWFLPLVRRRIETTQAQDGQYLRPSDPAYEQVLDSLAMVARHTPVPLLEPILRWRETESPKGANDASTFQRNLAVECIFCSACIRFVECCPQEGLTEKLWIGLENLVFDWLINDDR